MRVVRQILRSAGYPESTNYPSGMKDLPHETGGFVLEPLFDRVLVTWVPTPSMRKNPSHLGLSGVRTALENVGLPVEQAGEVVEVLAVQGQG